MYSTLVAPIHKKSNDYYCESYECTSPGTYIDLAHQRNGPLRLTLLNFYRVLLFDKRNFFSPACYCCNSTSVQSMVCFFNVTACQMSCLFCLLPIIIGDKVDVDMEEWHCFFKLWNIVKLCTAPVIRKDDILCLRVLIEEHLTLFKRLYPNGSAPLPMPHFQNALYGPHSRGRSQVIMNSFFSF